MRGMTHRPTIPQPSVVHRLIRGLSAGFSTGLSLGLPVSCAGCGCWETALCPRCRELLEGEPFNVEHADAAGDLDILALTTYTGPVRTMVLGWKNGSREDLAEVMAHAGRHLGRQWAQGRPAKEIWTESLPHTPALLVVPAPSGIARRLRGRLVAARLADAVASGIAEQWAQREQATLWDEPPAGDAPASMPSREALPAPLVLSADLLRRRGGGAHQAGRSSRQRRGNRTAAPRLLAPVSGLPVLLVDDVMSRNTIRPDELFPTRTASFEGRRFAIPAQAEKILRDYYGNWQRIPPEDQRPPAHVRSAEWVGDQPYAG